MNSSILALVVMSLVVSGNLSFAATTTKANVKTAKAAATETDAKKKGKKKKSTEPTPAPTGQVAPAAKPAAAAVAAPSLTAPVASQGSTSISIAKATKEAKPSAWSAKYRTENGVSVKDVQNSQGEVTAEDRAYINYSLNDTTTISAVQYIEHTWFGKREGSFSSAQGAQGPAFLTLGDTYAEINNSNIAVLGDSGIEYSAGVRLTGATSEGSRLKGELGSVRFHNYLTKSFGKLTVDFYDSPQVYVEKQQTYTKISDGVASEAQNNMFRNIAGLEFSYAIVGGLAFEPNVYWTNIVTQPDDNAGKASTRKDLLELDALMTYTFNSHVKVQGGLINDEGPGGVDMRALNEPYQAFRPSQTIYYLKADFKI